MPPRITAFRYRKTARTSPSTVYGRDGALLGIVRHLEAGGVPLGWQFADRRGRVIGRGRTRDAAVYDATFNAQAFLRDITDEDDR